MAPVEIDSTRTRGASGPIFMMDPLPQLFSICAIARFKAFLRSSCVVEAAIDSPSVERKSIIPEQNTKPLPRNQCARSIANAFSTCAMRMSSPHASTPITSNRYSSPGSPNRSIQIVAARHRWRRFSRPTAQTGPPNRRRVAGLHFDERHDPRPPDDEVEVAMPARGNGAPPPATPGRPASAPLRAPPTRPRPPPPCPRRHDSPPPRRPLINPQRRSRTNARRQLPHHPVTTAAHHPEAASAPSSLAGVDARGSRSGAT